MIIQKANTRHNRNYRSWKTESKDTKLQISNLERSLAEVTGIKNNISEAETLCVAPKKS